ncbi:MAG: 5-dehydro-4-deoxy-D-glucuronate isomerase [Clostridiales bacterium]|jgi:4-deoxy-L-threo-5-hexosulose-uronate ketol-isomerase|nr:5-dehydro-4-deoxy-D-glucuronate isomerase [Clostridiales bacterium]
MKILDSVSRRDFKTYDTERIRGEFLTRDVFVPGGATYVYSHTDRVVFGGAVPLDKPLALENGAELRADYFLQRREIGIINIGGGGKIECGGRTYPLSRFDCLYAGKGTRSVKFYSDDAQNPAKFYFNSVCAHAEYPTTLIGRDAAARVDCGSKGECNERTIYKYILPQTVKSCQLVMGLTILKEGSVWNTMPSHTHERRMEVYLYFDMKKDNIVFHFMGEPSETRHIAVHNEQAVLSPSFSIHSGCGTANYSFIWGMCGENQDFDDMSKVGTLDIK